MYPVSRPPHLYQILEIAAKSIRTHAISWDLYKLLKSAWRALSIKQVFLPFGFLKALILTLFIQELGTSISIRVTTLPPHRIMQATYRHLKMPINAILICLKNANRKIVVGSPPGTNTFHLLGCQKRLFHPSDNINSKSLYSGPPLQVIQFRVCHKTHDLRLVGTSTKNSFRFQDISKII